MVFIPVFAQTIYTWSGGSGNWNDPLKWTPSGTPGASDTAIVNNGTITLSANANPGGLNLNGGILNGSGNLTISGTFRWNGGRLEGTGTTRVLQNGFMKIGGASDKELNFGVLINQGSATWDGDGEIGIRNGAQFQNTAGATLEIRNNAVMDYLSPGGGTFSNNGTLLKSSGGNDTVIDVHYAGEGPMTINSGKMMLKRSSSLNAGAVSIASNCELKFSGGTHAINGVSFQGAGMVEIINASITVNSAGATFAAGIYVEMKESNSVLTLGGPIAVHGIFDWNRGTIQGASTLMVDGLLKITSTNSRKLDGVTLQNKNLAVWSGTGSTRLVNGAVIQNDSGSEFDIERDVTVDYLEPGGGSFINSGTLTKNDGNGTLLFKVYFENHEVVHIEEGSVQFTRGGTSVDAVYNIDGGCLLDFNGGNQTLNDVIFSGNGSVKFSKDAIHVTNGGATIHSGVSASMSAGTLNCAAPLANNGKFYWNSGTLTGAGGLVSDGEFHFTASNFVDLNALTLVNNGLMTWPLSGTIKLKNSGQIINQAGGTFDIQSDGLLDYVLADNGGSFINAGTMTKSGGSGISYIDAVFTNSGTVNAHSGILRFERGSTSVSSGAFNVAAGKLLVFAERTFILDNALFGGQGTVSVEDATLSINGTGIAIEPSLKFSIDNNLSLLNGSGPILNNGVFNWTRGTISGSGEFRVNGSLNISGELLKTLSGKTLSNHGNITWSGSGMIRLGNNAQIMNQPGAVFDIQNNTSVSFLDALGGVIHNSGTLKKSSGAGVCTLAVNYYNSGVTEVLSGVLRFTKQFSNEVSGNIRGNGALDLSAAVFNNNGSVSPGTSPGSLTVTGNYTQAPGARLNAELAGYTPGSQYDRLIVSGTANLDGILNISLLGNFNPPEGEEFIILNSGLRNGQFTQVNGPTISGLPVFEVNYEGGQVVLTVVRQNLSITAVNDYATTDEDTETSLNVLLNDNTTQGNNLTISGFSAPANGSAVQVDDSTFSYTPAENFFGVDSFFYFIHDQSNATDSARVLITVLPVNDPPVISAPLPDITFPEDSSQAIDLNPHAFDVDNDSTELTWSAVVISAQIPGLNPNNALGGRKATGLTGIEVEPEDLQISIDPLTGIASFSATGDTSGIFTVVFTVSDPGGLSASDTMMVTVTPVEDLPFVANPLPDVSYPEDSGWQTVSPNLNQVFSDPDPGTVFTFSAISDNPDIQTSLTGDSLLLISSPDYFGSGAVVVSANDGARTVVSDTFSVTITAVNDPPQFSGLPDSLSFDSDSSAVLNLWEFVEDVETPDSLLNFEFAVSEDSLQTAYDSGSGTLLLSALGGFSGTVELIIRATDPENASAEDTVSVTVNPVIIVGIGDDLLIEIPREFALQQNFPNPFNPATTIRYQLASAAQVRLTVYNILGQKIRILVNERMEAGYYQAEWDGRDDWGRPLGSGIYIYRLEAGNFRMVRKMTLLK